MSNVPKLRFKEFRASKECACYKKHIFEDIFSFSTGKNIKHNEASPEFEIPCVRYGELYHMYGEVISKIINRTNLDKSELLFSQGNEILLPSAGEDPWDIGSASALTIANIAIGRTINILRPLSDNVYSQKYVAYYINQKLRKKISTLAKGVSISNVYNSDLKKLSINLPCLSEQEKIASFLISVDTKVEQLIKKEKLLKQYKKGLKQKIFSQEIRFKTDDGNEYAPWEKKKLGKILKEYSDKDNSALNEVVSVGKYGIRKRDEIYSKELSKDISKNKVIYQNTLSIGMGSTQIDIGILLEDKIYSVSPAYSTFKIIETDSYFLEQLLIILNKKLSSLYMVTGARQGKSVNKAELLNHDVMIPSQEEQTKIASFLSSIDTKIEQVQKQLESTKAFKKGLLQQMFV